MIWGLATAVKVNTISKVFFSLRPPASKKEIPNRGWAIPPQPKYSNADVTAEKGPLLLIEYYRSTEVPLFIYLDRS